MRIEREFRIRLPISVIGEAETVRDILTAMPSAWPFIEGINNFILNGDLYHALKESKRLICHEEKLLESARSLQAITPDGGRKSA